MACMQVTHWAFRSPSKSHRRLSHPSSSDALIMHGTVTSSHTASIHSCTEQAPAGAAPDRGPRHARSRRASPRPPLRPPHPSASPPEQRARSHNILITSPCETYRFPDRPGFTHTSTAFRGGGGKTAAPAAEQLHPPAGSAARQAPPASRRRVQQRSRRLRRARSPRSTAAHARAQAPPLALSCRPARPQPLPRAAPRARDARPRTSTAHPAGPPAARSCRTQAAV